MFMLSFVHDLKNLYALMWKLEKFELLELLN